MKIAIIAGTSIHKSNIFDNWNKKVSINHYGHVYYAEKDNFIVMNRHRNIFRDGTEFAPFPPHNINYHANIKAIDDLGIKHIIGLSSVGSLSNYYPPGRILSCSDYVNIQSPPKTFYDLELKGGKNTGFTNQLNIHKEINRLESELYIDNNTTYVQMQGPRFETKAEVRIIKGWGHCVGMTQAHEADLANELDIDYNSICVVDNYANGINNTEINFDKFKDLVKDNQEKVDKLLLRILEIYK